jgi:hypothetical protein
LVIVDVGFYYVGDARTEPRVVSATAEHPFWVPALRSWVPARSLAAGMTVHGRNGAAVVVAAVGHRAETTRVHNLTIAGIHTYYVFAGDAPILVHNTGPGCGSLWMNPDRMAHHFMSPDNNGVMHAAAFGVTGNYNKANAQRFIAAIEHFTKHPETVQIRGTFRGQNVVHYVNPNTGLHASFAADGPNVGEYVAGWQSEGDQLKYLLGQGLL